METEGPLAFTNVRSVQFKAAVESSVKVQKGRILLFRLLVLVSSSKGHHGALLVDTCKTMLLIIIKKQHFEITTIESPPLRP